MTYSEIVGLSVLLLSVFKLYSKNSDSFSWTNPNDDDSFTFGIRLSGAYVFLGVNGLTCFSTIVIGKSLY